MKFSDLPVPTNYTGADTAEWYDLKRRITACLSGRIPDLQGIHITVYGNTATLRGEVRSLHEKRRCLECCRHVPGVMRVVDDLTLAEQTPTSREEEWS